MNRQRKDKFNQSKGECSWPTYLHTDNIVSDCRFPIEDLDVLEQNARGTIKIVRLPAETTIYHKTMSINKHKWWENFHPINTHIGGIFFSTSKKHIERNIHGTHILEYKTLKDIELVYIQNIYKYCGAMNGDDFIKKCYPALLKQLEKESEYDIKGYIGCNECELFIDNKNISSGTIIPMKPFRVQEMDMRFID